MKRIYLDNAASTCPFNDVVEAMLPYLRAFGNPSAIHGPGRWLKVGLERARVAIATHLNAQASEVFFCASGTEANNWALRNILAQHNIQHVIALPLEHASVYEVLQQWRRTAGGTYQDIAVDWQGKILYDMLEAQLHTACKVPTLVVVMHASNELGTLYDIARVGDLCNTYGALFHSDMVQTFGHVPICVKAARVHSASISAHKFHGPRGIGCLYINAQAKPRAWLVGGAQERGMRAGTEAVACAVGMAKACEMMYANKQHIQKIQQLKSHTMALLKNHNIAFNGPTDELNSLPTILNVRLPKDVPQDVVLMRLDMEGIAASAGSACASGSLKPSRIMKSIQQTQSFIRFSFSPFNDTKDIDKACGVLVEAIKKCL